MKKTVIITLLTLLAITCSATAFAQGIEIKGLRLGMTKAEIEKKFGPLPINNFTIAEVPGKFPVRLEFYEGKLDELMFFFSSKDFNEVRKAVISKNPELKCADSTVTSPAGKSFNQVNCKLTDQLGILRVDRFVRDIDTSAVTLTSHRLFQELEKEHKDKPKNGK